MSEFTHTVVMPLKMLKYLRIHGKVKIEELSKELRLEERTVRRYYESLKASGYPIRSKRGKNGGYYLEEQPIYPAEWEILRSALRNYPNLYNKIQTRLLEEFKPQD